MKNWMLSACVTLFTLTISSEAAEDYSTIRNQAEALVAQGSYAKAHTLYLKASELPNLTSNEVRWVQFRLADTEWRSAAGTDRADTTRLDQARTALERMVRDLQRQDEQDRVWVEVQESLGDFWWTRRNRQSWGQAWPYYQRALDWWAGQSDLDLARDRYLSVVWRCARPPVAMPYYRYGSYGNYVPLDILRNALEIAQTDEDKAHAHYLIASTLQQQGGNWEQQARVPEEYEAALVLGRKTDWYDDALYNYAEWMEQRGRFVPLDGGGYRNEPDYVKALELFRRLTREYVKGETRYFDQAQTQIREITAARLNVSVANIFLPDSEIESHLDWRNVKHVEMTLYPVDITQDVSLQISEDRHRTDWLNSIDLEGREAVKSWGFDTEDQGKHRPGDKALRVDQKLKPGAYVLEARAGAEWARDLVLVTDAAVVLKSSGRQALVYVCDVISGAPLAESKVTLCSRWREENRWQTARIEGQTDKDGLVVFDLQSEAQNLELFVGARHKDRQAFSTGDSWRSSRGGDSWKIYAYTDRPAYRPGETVHWKFTARRDNGSVYSTPANARVEFEILDARGTRLKADTVSLNQFGSAWGTLELTDQMPLGEYRMTFWDEGRKNRIGYATLFRLEEYKLPEFKVTVTTSEESVDGASARKKAFRLGDTVEATIEAAYYFGGPVSDAEVEVIVYQNPFWMTWQQPREFPWFYEDTDQSRQPWRRGWGNGQIVKRVTLKTDAAGKAIVSFETPTDSSQGYQYRIEARVTDSSRREIIGNGTVRVTRQRYYVNARAQHNLYRPNNTVTVEFQAQDANENPVSVDGTVKVTRQYWWEVWIAPDGTEVKGDELKRLRARHRVWPPPPERPDQKDWKLKFRGYEQDEILTRSVRTDTNGLAEFSFSPERVGYYQLHWTSEDRVAEDSGLRYEVTAATTVWVTDNQSTDIGYRQGGVQIIVDKDTFRVGNEAPVMLVANSPDRYVLFTVEGENLQSYRLVHLTGTVKLINLLIGEEDVPNIFLGATLVSDREIFTDTQQVIVPPTKNFLTVEVTPDRKQYQPHDDGTLTVTTRDAAGKPVSAEVALSLVDESVFYIQSDYAGDPRQFFFGTKRPHRVWTQSTLNQKRYAKLIEFKDAGLMDERDVLRARGEVGERNEFYFAGAADHLAFAKMPASRAREGMAVGRQAETPVLTAMPAITKSMSAAGSMAMAYEAPALDEDKAPGTEPAVVVRSDFRSTILWQPDVQTGADGTATVKVSYPDSVTGWKATARAASSGNQFGIGDATTRTKQPLIVRLQAPRFFVVGDLCAVSAVINNNTDTPLHVLPGIEAEGLVVSGLFVDGEFVKGEVGPVEVPANGEGRVDWAISVQHAGPVKIQVTGRAREAKLADAMERSYVAYEHGIEKFITRAGKVRGDDVTVKLEIPRERKPDSTTLTVQVTPSLAVTMLDALPYLIDYPYGCTEQTMSRFLPAVITAGTLKDLGLQPEEVMKRVFGGIETNWAAATHSKGKRDLAKLDDMTQAGLDRLYDFQHSDGGWGWWKQGDSDHWMTAYVVWGLTLAKQAGVEVRASVIRRGADFLDKNLVEEEERPDMQAWMLHALAVQKAADKESGLSQFQQKAFDNLWNKRDQLNAYTRALFALAAQDLGKTDEAKILVQNLENGVIRDERPDTSILVHATRKTQQPGVMGTAHWGEDGIFWRWSDGGVEATAFALRALLAIDPQNELVEPVTNWLIKNRRGAQWSNTRDTAIVVLAMNDYLRMSGELQADMEFEVFVSKSVAKQKVGGADVLNAPSRFAVDAKLIRDGENQIRIKRKGEGAVYFAAEATFFSLEEPIPAAGNEIFVKRQYYKMVGRPTLLKGYVYDKVALLDGDSVASGDRVETVITIEAKNNYEYLVFEDLKPAGFEAVEIRSGEPLHARELKRGTFSDSDSDPTGRRRWVYQELRDRKVALFIDKLPQGVWQVRYDVRAEVPGEFHALPVLGHAMYVPEIRCNGDELRVTVTEED